MFKCADPPTLGSVGAPSRRGLSLPAQGLRAMDTVVLLGAKVSIASPQLAEQKHKRVGDRFPSLPHVAVLATQDHALHSHPELSWAAVVLLSADSACPSRLTGNFCRTKLSNAASLPHCSRIDANTICNREVAHTCHTAV